MTEVAKLYPDLDRRVDVPDVRPEPPLDQASFTVPQLAAGIETPWYAAYTWANHEKRVAAALLRKQVNHFLPLYLSERRWSDRKVRLELPLFPGYVFVQLPKGEKLQVLEVAGVVHLVGFNGRPVALSDSEIDVLRQLMTRGSRHLAPHPFLTAGRRVRIVRGPLVGLEGILLRRKGALRVVLSIQMIQRSMVVDADAADIEPVSRELRIGGRLSDL